MAKIPEEVIEIIEKLEKKNFQAFVVGGCVRDYLQNVIPNDWDIATSATPESSSPVASSSARTTSGELSLPTRNHSHASYLSEALLLLSFSKSSGVFL